MVVLNRVYMVQVGLEPTSVSLEFLCDMLFKITSSDKYYEDDNGNNYRNQDTFPV